jgi:glucosamine-6-phosphate deaminase
MIVKTYSDRAAMSRAAGRHAGRSLRDIISRQGTARIVAATGASQLTFLETLVAEEGIDWSKVELFHLDEYVALPIDHPASFRKFLLERLITKVGMRRYHLLDGEQDPDRVAAEASQAIAAAPVDIAFAGIGENGHLAFNDPPADFETTVPYLVVTLDTACRRQQVGEGWFASIEEVPLRAISMSIHRVLQSREIICVVPDARKAVAVQACVEGDVAPERPASILKTHPLTTLYLDRASASLLSPVTRGAVIQDDRA